VKTVILTILTLGGAVLLLPYDASAQSARHYAWCAQYSGGDSGGAANCYFRTRTQCMNTVSGVGGYCEPNPFYDAAEYPERPRHHRRARHY
jgi:hypothetical protein